MIDRAPPFHFRRVSISASRCLTVLIALPSTLPWLAILLTALLTTLARVLALLLIVAVTVLLAALLAALSAFLVLLIVLAHGFLAPCGMISAASQRC
jgi:cellulose synthase/poly-beta-1,6-N-acetylglucosamine synthase-like glycosyltransferase